VATTTIKTMDASSGYEITGTYQLERRAENSLWLCCGNESVCLGADPEYDSDYERVLQDAYAVVDCLRHTLSGLINEVQVRKELEGVVAKYPVAQIRAALYHLQSSEGV